MVQHQVYRKSNTVWEVLRQERIAGDTWESEVVGRIVLDGGYYHVELPEWGDKGIKEWHRQPQAYQLLKRAARAVTEWEALAS